MKRTQPPRSKRGTPTNGDGFDFDAADFDFGADLGGFDFDAADDDTDDDQPPAADALPSFDDIEPPPAGELPSFDD